MEKAVTTLWDTTGPAGVKAPAAERRTGGAVTSGIALTLVVVVDHENLEEAEEAATVAASRHPMRMLVVIRRQIDAPGPVGVARGHPPQDRRPGPPPRRRGDDRRAARPGRVGGAAHVRPASPA